jgi:cytoskeletal protein CcmA (bactofilin family)
VSLFGGKRRDEGEEAARGAAPGPAEGGRPAAATADSGGTRPAARSEGSASEGRAGGAEQSPRRGEAVANIGKSIIFKGDLTGDEDIEIEGQIDGRIELPKNQLTIGAHGRVKAEINAKAVVVVGQVTGNVHATERVEIQSSGVVEGDIRAPRLLIQEGAVVNGAVEMTKGEGAAARKPEQRPATPAATPGGGPASGSGLPHGGEVRKTG